MAGKHDKGNERDGSNAPVKPKRLRSHGNHHREMAPKTESAIMRVAYGEHSKGQQFDILSEP